MLEIENLSWEVGAGRARKTILHDINLRVQHGRTMGLVGESGSGKSSLAKCVAGLIRPSMGAIRLEGQDLAGRRRVGPAVLHMVMQDSLASMNPRLSIAQIVAEPFLCERRGDARQARRHAGEWLERVGIPERLWDRHPHSLSGGQRQRINIARALSLRPKVLIADEPVSALDVSIQASVLNLLMQLQRDEKFTCLFITHSLPVVNVIADDVAVMSAGRIVDLGPVGDVLENPRDPYTQRLIGAVPHLDLSPLS